MIVCLRTVVVPPEMRAASDVHQAVTYRPIVRYDLAGGYTNLPGLAAITVTQQLIEPTPTKEDRQ